MEEEPTVNELTEEIREATIAQQLVPVLMGTALKNSGVQTLLDAVVSYLPSPVDVPNTALDTSNDEAQVPLKSDSSEPLVALAFKLEEGKFGQLTYMRVYQGEMKKGMQIFNASSANKTRVPRLVRMHSDEMEDIDQVGAGEI